MEELLNFLRKAKGKTYASLWALPKKIEGGGKRYAVKKGDFTYKDVYYGEKQFFGQEIVFRKNKAIWSMTYNGGIIGKYTNSEKCYRFLKSCLRKMPADFPIRGPKTYTKGTFKYINSWQGDIKKFRGEEKIFFRGKLIYSLNYGGGLILY